MEIPEASPTMMGKVKGEQPVVKSDDSDVFPSFSYLALAHGPASSEPLFAIAESRAKGSATERKVFTCLTSIPEENFSPVGRASPGPN